MLPRRHHLLQIGHTDARAWRQTLLLGFQQHQADSASPFTWIYESPERGNPSNTLNTNPRKTVRKILKWAITRSLYCSLASVWSVGIALGNIALGSYYETACEHSCSLKLWFSIHGVHEVYPGGLCFIYLFLFLKKNFIEFLHSLCYSY